MIYIKNASPIAPEGKAAGLDVKGYFINICFCRY